MKAERLKVAPPGSTAQWEQAYWSFETPEQEIRKFLGRLRALGANRWDRSSGILEVCCGRGSGLLAWHHLGFSDVVGLDLSRSLLSEYVGPGRCLVADARIMPLADCSRDIVVEQGGLHHLSTLEDVDLALREMCRVVKPGGRLIIVEPWPTPFLRLVHAVAEHPLARRLSRKIDALGRMIDLERQTYEAWLSAPDRVLGLIQRHVEPVTLRIRWGKLMMVGRRRGTGH